MRETGINAPHIARKTNIETHKALHLPTGQNTYAIVLHNVERARMVDGSLCLREIRR